MKALYPHVTCHDGTTLSIQASQHHYCTPRADSGPYTHVEVGYPSVTPPESWAEYADGEYPDCEIYGYVPVELVLEFIQLHGGCPGLLAYTLLGIEVPPIFAKKREDEND